MTDLEYITYCYESELSSGEKQAFEKRVAEDPLFAEEVVFFLNSLQAVEAQDAVAQKQKFREIYDQKKVQATIVPFRRVLYALAAAAALACIIIGYNLLGKTVPPDQLAQQYVHENLNDLPTSMGAGLEGKQNGVDLYNKGKYAEALIQFEILVKNDSLNVDAQKYEGIVYLRLGNYEKAISQFRYLENMKGLNSNPGKFYHALTLMDRNAPGDATEARFLLQDVVSQNLEGSQTAKQWLKKL